LYVLPDSACYLIRASSKGLFNSEDEDKNITIMKIEGGKEENETNENFEVFWVVTVFVICSAFVWW